MASPSWSYRRVVADCTVFILVGLVLSRAILAWMENAERQKFLEDLEVKGIQNMADKFRQELGKAAAY